jgi:hypothetical protein
MPKSVVGPVVVLMAACATAPATGFREAVVEKPSLPGSALLEVCWPDDAPPDAKVTLHFLANDEVLFEATDNSTGRCMREIAQTYPWGAERPSGDVELKPAHASGWAVLAYVKLLSASRFGPERGLLDPAPLVAACNPRPGATFAIRGATVAVLPTGPVTDADRCVEAVLGATAWPSSRPFTFELNGKAPAAAGDVSLYFAPQKTLAPLEPQRVHDAIMLVKPRIGVCWESALNRRAGLSGGRTVRIAVAEDGSVESATIASNATDARASAADYLLDKCLIEAVRTARFGPGAGDTAYSWVFGDRAG